MRDGERIGNGNVGFMQGLRVGSDSETLHRRSEKSTFSTKKTQKTCRQALRGQGMFILTFNRLLYLSC